MTNATAVDEQNKTVEELQTERDEAMENYAKLTKAHNKLKEDLTNMKAGIADAGSLQKQIENLTTDKTKLMREKDELKSEFDYFKSDIKQKETKQLVTSALEEAGVKSTATALKLLDMEAIKFDESGAVIPESLQGAIEALKTEHEIIFSSEKDVTTKPSAPAVKHAVDTVTKSAYEAEMAAAVKSGSMQQLEEVFAKYQKH